MPAFLFKCDECGCDRFHAATSEMEDPHVEELECVDCGHVREVSA